MSLLFDANGELVDHGSDATDLDNIATGYFMAAIRSTDFTSDSGNAVIFDKGGILQVQLWIDTFAGQLFFQIGRATTVLAISGTAAQLGAHWAINNWLFVAATWATGGVNGDQKIFTGSLTQPMIEPSAYTLQQVGAGARTSDAASNLTVGGTATAGEYLRGRVAWAILSNGAQLTRGQARNLQFKPRVLDANAVLYTQYGFAGTGTQPDWSGKFNSGTVTGATVAPHVPCQFLDAISYSPYVVAAAAGWGHLLSQSRNRLVVEY